MLLQLICAILLQQPQDTVQLEALGPIAVAADGSLHRVSNWHELTTNERETAKKALARRNAKRLSKLEARSRQQPSDPVWRKVRLTHSWVRQRWLTLRLPSMDFAPEYVPLIVNHDKRATTRL